MKVSIDWLKQYVTVTETPAELAKRLTGVGIAVETVSARNQGVKGILVGQVEEIERVAGSETLWVARVDVGRPAGKLQIVTSAQNVRRGCRVPVAPPGAIIGGEPLGVAEFRGTRSEGMMLAEDELGIGDDHEGILILPDDAPIGADAAELLGLNDHVLELELTANYAAHAQSMIGVAIEYGALAGVPVKWPEIDAAQYEDPALGQIKQQMQVTIEDPELCPRYSGRIVRGVKIGPSPLWMQTRLRAAGMRPINNIVDITNYVMLELGQPLHAFDYDRIRGQQIIVRRAKDGETFRTLDGVDRTLDSDVLAICDAEGPVALAGVMGGEESEVTDATVNIFLESAWFHNINNRRTARRYNLPSEASSRFTKGVDPSGTIRAMERAVQLMCELAGGRAVPGIIDEYPRPYAPKVVPLRLRKLQTVIGLPISRETATQYLTRLGFAVLPGGEIAADVRALPAGGAGREMETPVWRAVHRVSPVPEEPAAYANWAEAARKEVLAAGETVQRWNESDVLIAVVPTRRLDVSIEDDLVEEVCRQHGYDRIEATLPQGPAIRGGRPRHQELMLRARRILAGAGLAEVMTYSLTTPKIYDKMRLPPDHPHRHVLTVQNPLYEERSTLRTLLSPSLLDVLQYNANRQVRDMAIFEIAKVYHVLPEQDGGGLPHVREEWRLSIAAMGNLVQKGWNTQERPVDYYWLKGVIEHLLASLGITDYYLGRGTQCPFLHPGRHSGLGLHGGPEDPNHVMLGVFGEAHPEVSAAWDLPGRVYLAELEFMPLVDAARDLRPYTPVPRFPAVTRDVALVIGREVPAGQVLQTIRSAGGDLVEEVRLFDLYQGAPVPEGKRSLAYSITYRSAERTLTDDEVAAAHNRVRGALAALGAELRS